MEGWFRAGDWNADKIERERADRYRRETEPDKRRRMMTKKDEIVIEIPADWCDDCSLCASDGCVLDLSDNSELHEIFEPGPRCPGPGRYRLVREEA